MAIQPKQHFDALASNYDKPHTIQRAEAIAAAIRNQLRISPAMSALDFGAGTGSISFALLPYLSSITALDKSQAMVEVLRERIDSQQVECISAVVCDNFIEDYNNERPFDLVYSVMTMHHIPNVGAVLKKFYTLLGPGGLVAVSDLDAEDGSFHSDITEVHHHGFDRDKMAVLLADAGFQNIKASTAYKYTKEAATGEAKEYSIFLITAEK